MPLIATRGAASAQGFGEFAQATGPVTYIEDVFSTYLYTGTGATRIINNGIALGDAVTLVGKTITNLGGSFSSAYPITNINDGILETANAYNVGFVPSGSGYFDVYVDLGSAIVVTAYQIAPQGAINSAVYNTPTAFTVKASNDAVTWTTITSFTSISTDYPNWNAGTFRVFSFANTTAYRYWRLENTTFGSGNNGVGVSEWSITASQSGAGKGGLVWWKSRSGISSNLFQDTVRGITKVIRSNDAGAETTETTYVTSVSTTGFDVGTSLSVSDTTYATWTFREQPKFFDIVTYTGNGTNPRNITHNLGSTPGCIIVKRTDTTGNWNVYHRSAAAGGFTAEQCYMYLNSTNAVSDNSTFWSDTAPTSTQFTVGSASNANGGTYVAYLFAHNAGGFGLTGSDNVISCGSYTGNSGTLTVNLGYEPQWLLVKRTDFTGNWALIDVMRGWIVGASSQQIIYANTSGAETGDTFFGPTATGFSANLGGTWNSNGGTYIYIAIRRGPMKTPTSGTSVFTPVAYTGNGTARTTVTDIVTDLSIIKRRNTAYNPSFEDRLRGANQVLESNTNAAEIATAQYILGFDVQNGVRIGTDVGVNQSGSTFINWAFSRAPGFFDVVCYTGNGTSNRAITHNLGVTPELIIVKDRTSANLGMVYNASGGAGKFLRLFDGGTGDYPFVTNSSPWNNTSPTSTQFTVDGTGGYIYVNASGNNYVAYLFASVSGVSKVGSYTGSTSVQTINCGFTNGARFVLIKRTDAAGNWIVYDSARGIVAGNDPYLLLNKSDAEDGGDDDLEADSSGFIVNPTPDGISNPGINGATYIFLAIA